MNKVLLIGRLTDEPAIRYTTGENAMCVAQFSLAVDRGVRRDAGPDVQKADFPRCILFNKSAELAKDYLHKGTKIALEGRIQTGSYVNKDGQKVYTTDIVGDRFEFVESKGASQNNSGSASGGSRNTADATFMNVPDNLSEEELPF